MSISLYTQSGLRFWSEKEIQIREQAIQTIYLALSKALKGQNAAWVFERVEGPLITPRSMISDAYDDSDIFGLNAEMAQSAMALRAETTASSYAYATHLLSHHEEGGAKPPKLPLCVWQVGKSFRRETNDGARASELRFNEFYQLEFQCIYSAKTSADVRAVAMDAVETAIRQVTLSTQSRRIPSDRLPDYSIRTDDIEVPFGAKIKEMASISTRKDFPKEDTLVLEVAVGLDRLVEVAMRNLNQ